MRKLLGLVAAAAIAVGAAAPAGAAPVPVNGVLNVVVGTLPPLALAIPPLTVVDVTGGTLTIPAGIASASGLFVPVTGFPLNLITGIVVTASNGAGSFSPGNPAASGLGVSIAGGGFGGVMPVLGVAQVKGALAINVPLSNVGAGGSVNAGGIVVAGAPWTTGVAMVTTTGAPMAMATQAGTQAGVLGAPGSTVTLVTPAHVNAAGLARLPVFALLTLQFVPEPGTLLLLTAGIAGLAAVGRARK